MLPEAHDLRRVLPLAASSMLLAFQLHVVISAMTRVLPTAWHGFLDMRLSPLGALKA